MPTCATSENTLQYSQRFNKLKYNVLGRSGLYVSEAGFGGYRVHISIPGHRTALTHALLNGINIIDTSSNYADGGSEELIGSVVNELQLQGKIKREEIVVVSKAGYLQGQNFQLSQELKQSGNPFPELVEYAQNLEHCIHPDFLEDQITRSLQRLKLETIDVFLLHNPEYYLLWAHENKIPLKEAQDEIYKRIEKAFMHLEIEVQNGRIQHYGISSNSFPTPSERYGFLELERIWDIAINISTNHHFCVAQFPLNLLERGAVSEKNQVSGTSVIEFAESKSLGVLTNRPLNAFYNNQLTRLLPIILDEKFDPILLSKQFKQISALEIKFIEEILSKLNIEEEKQKELSGLFANGRYLENRYHELGPYWQWIENQARFITDQVSYAVQLINELPDKDKEIINWLNGYVELFNQLLGSLTLFYGQVSHQTNEKILSQIEKANPNFKDNTIQNHAINSLRQTKGVTSVLIGMRQKNYVDDVLYKLQKSTAHRDIDYWKNINI